MAYIYTHNIILKRLLLPFGFVCEHCLSDYARKVEDMICYVTVFMSVFISQYVFSVKWLDSTMFFSIYYFHIKTNVYFMSPLLFSTIGCVRQIEDHGYIITMWSEIIIRFLYWITVSFYPQIEFLLDVS